MACEGYSKTALMGNWYEERHAPFQKTNLDGNSKARATEKEISFPNNGSLVSLARISRREPWITQGIVPDDGYREFRSVFATTYDDKNLKILSNVNNNNPCLKKNDKKTVFPENNPYTALIPQSKQKEMVNVMNVAEIMKNERPIKEERTDFGSTMRRHPADYNRMYHLTTYMDSYTKAIRSSTADNTQFDVLKSNKFAGNPSTKSNTESKGKKVISLLIAESFKNEADPKQNTKCQKKWLPTNDPGIEAAYDNLSKTLDSKGNLYLEKYKQAANQSLKYDIATSLPIGEGEHVLKRKYLNPGEFRKIRSDVTILKNKPITKK